MAATWYGDDSPHRVPSNVQSSHQKALLYVFEDNEAANKTTTEGRRPSMRHVSRTHRVALTKKWSNSTKVSSPCLDDHQFKQEELESVEELSEVGSHILLKCLYLARIGRPDILRSVNKLARAVTKCSQACDGRLARLISYIHHTSDYRQYCHVGNTAQHCRFGVFQDSDFAGDFEDSKSTSERIFCIFFGSRTFVPNKLDV